MKIRLHSSLFLGMLALSASAQAEPNADAKPKEVSVEEARQRFQRGVDLYHEGSFDAALAEFTKVYDLAPNFRVLYNIAQVQTERHDYVAALKALDQYLKSGGADVPAERREQVSQEIADLKNRVAELSVHSNVEGAELLVDGVSVGQTPLEEPVLVSAGVRNVQLRKSGYAPSSRAVTIAGGEGVKLDFVLDPDRATNAGAVVGTGRAVTPESEADAVSRDSAGSAASGTDHTAMWVSLGSTVLLAGGAVTFGALTSQANRDLDKELGRFPAVPGAVDDARSSLRRDAALTDAFIAGTAIAGGFTLYFALSSSSDSSREHAKEAGLRIVPTLGGIRALGEF